MRKLFQTLVAIIAVSFFSSCETTPSAEATAESPTGAMTEVIPYPLSTCLVTGEGLESKGGAITQIYNGQEVKFCCKPCQFSFRKDPELFLAKLP